MSQKIIKNQRATNQFKIKRTLRAKILKRLADIFNFLYKKGMCYNALDSYNSLDLLLLTRKSYIRLGDGEFRIIAGFDQANQQYHPELRKGLIKIIKQYRPDSKYFLGLTNWNLTADINTLKKRKSYGIWRYARFFLWRFSIHKKSKMPYLETDMFRVGEVGLSNSEIERIWLPYEYIIIVHNSKEYFEWFKNKYPLKKMFFVKIPERDFFFVLNEKEQEILNIINYHKIPKEKLIILIAAGPGGKILCYNLINRDFYVCDMGHYFHMRYHLEKIGKED